MPLNKLTFIILMIIASSCISKKKLIFLQENPENRYSGLEEDITLDEFDYKLKSGDRVELRVFSITSSEYNFFNGDADNVAAPLKFQIDDTGNLELPVANKVFIEGQTILEAQNTIKEVLSNYLKSPVVQIELLKNFEFTIIGEANGNGNFSLPKIQVNILEALAEAGGLTDFADRSRIKIVRMEGERKTVYLVNVLDENLIRKKEYYIQSGDIIVVDTAKDKPTQPVALSVLTTALGVLTSIGFLIINLTRR